MFVSLIQQLSLAASIFSGGPAGLLNEVSLAPVVGDFVVLSGSLSKGGKSSAASSSVKNVDYDSSTDKMLVQSVLTVAGEEPIVENEWMNASEIIDQDIAPYIAQLVCENEDVDGDLVELETPVGTFVSCKMRVDEDSSQGYVWIGAVPFGVLKADLKDTNENIRFRGIVSQYNWQ